MGQELILLDAYPLIALLSGEPAALEIGRLIASDAAAIPAPNLAEAADVLGRVHGITGEETRLVVASLEESVDLAIRPVDERGAWRAAELRITHYDRTRCPISIPDCLLLAVTSPDDRVATADPDVLAVAHAEGIEWVALPDSRGERHPPGY